MYKLITRTCDSVLGKFHEYEIIALDTKEIIDHDSFDYISENQSVITDTALSIARKRGVFNR